MTRVECDDCSENFQTKKLYIKHLKSRKCQESRGQGTPPPPDPKRQKLVEPNPPPGGLLKLVTSPGGVVGGVAPSAQYSPRQMESLQAQISTLTPTQKAELQAQITEKQRQVLQAIPYNQLSAKQKEILKRLTNSKQPNFSSPSTPTQQIVTNNVSTPKQQHTPTAISTPKQISPASIISSRQQSQTPIPNHRPQPQAATSTPRQQVPTSISNPRQLPLTSVTNPRQPTTIAATPRLPQSQNKPGVVKLSLKQGQNTGPQYNRGTVVTAVGGKQGVASNRGNRVVQPQTVRIKPPSQITEEVVSDFVFSDDPIADNEGESEKNPLDIVDSLQTDSDLPSTLHRGKIGTIKVRNMARTLQEVSNIVIPVATQKENCPICKKIFSKSSMAGHIESKHKVDCRQCPDRFLPEELSTHISQVHMPAKEKCSICSEMLFPEPLRQHIELFHKKECSSCKIKILSSRFNDHIREVHESERCEECEQGFETKTLLINHEIAEHPKEKCLDCDSLFSTQQILDDHVVEAHPKEFCDDCDAVFSNVDKLKEHKDIAHPNPNKFLNFNGGMFMMMMVPEQQNVDDSDKEEEPEDTTNEEVQSAGSDKESEAKLEDKVVTPVKPSGTFLMRMMIDEDMEPIENPTNANEFLARKILHQVLEDVFERLHLSKGTSDGYLSEEDY